MTDPTDDPGADIPPDADVQMAAASELVTRLDAKRKLQLSVGEQEQPYGPEGGTATAEWLATKGVELTRERLEVRVVYASRETRLRFEAEYGADPHRACEWLLAEHQRLEPSPALQALLDARHAWLRQTGKAPLLPLTPKVRHTPAARPAPRRPRSRRTSGDRASPADEDPAAPPRATQSTRPEVAVVPRRGLGIARQVERGVELDDRRDERRRTSGSPSEPAMELEAAMQADSDLGVYWVGASAPARSHHALEVNVDDDTPTRSAAPKRPREVLRQVGRLPHDFARATDARWWATWIAAELLKRTPNRRPPGLLTLNLRGTAGDVELDDLRRRLRLGIEYIAAHGLELQLTEADGELVIGVLEAQMELGL